MWEPSRSRVLSVTPFATWILDATGWAEVLGTVPACARVYRLMHDRAGARSVLLCEESGRGADKRTFVHDGVEWRELPVPGPGADDPAPVRSETSDGLDSGGVLVANANGGIWTLERDAWRRFAGLPAGQLEAILAEPPT